MSWNGYLPGAVAHNNVLALPDDLKSGLLQGADGILMVNAGNAWPNYTPSSRISASWRQLSRVPRYSWMASRMFSSASSSVSPSDQHPGRAGAETLERTLIFHSSSLLIGISFPFPCENHGIGLCILFITNSQLYLKFRTPTRVWPLSSSLPQLDPTRP